MKTLSLCTVLVALSLLSVAVVGAPSGQGIRSSPTSIVLQSRRIIDTNSASAQSQTLREFTGAASGKGNPSTLLAKCLSTPTSRCTYIVHVPDHSDLHKVSGFVHTNLSSKASVIPPNALEVFLTVEEMERLENAFGDAATAYVSEARDKIATSLYTLSNAQVNTHSTHHTGGHVSSSEPNTPSSISLIMETGDGVVPTEAEIRRLLDDAGCTALRSVEMEVFPIEGREGERDGAMIVIGEMSTYTAMCVAETMAEETYVRWIERKNHATVLNVLTRGIAESGGIGESFETFRENGITGTGEIVACSDSGLDYGNCFFYDTNGVPVNTISSTHRKLVTYNTVGGSGDTRDEAGSHGTHVAGTILGSTRSASSDEDWAQNFHGVAEGAKLAFYDLNSYLDDDASSINVPQPMATLFDRGTAAGAKVFTNSWGTTGNYISSFSRQADEWAYNNQDTLVLFAAGNAGDFGLFTVGEPSVGKNVVSVGSVDSSNKRSSLDCCLSGGCGGTCCDLDALTCTVGSTSTAPSEDIASYSSKGPACPIGSAGGSFACGSYQGRLKPDISVPGTGIWSAYGSGTTEYSCSQSVGSPTAAVAQLSGTSMATPLAAGMATLARQYFRDGYYPTGAATPANALTPTSALLKAVLVHSAQEMTGQTSLNGFTSDIVDLDGDAVGRFVQGFGRAQLSAALPLPSVPLTPSEQSLHVFDSQSLSVEGSSEQYCLRLLEDVSELRATLVYMDESVSLFATEDLVNDLDLRVWGSNNVFQYGNGAITPPYNVRDNVNNVEQIRLENAQAGLYLFDVTITTRASLSSQDFALMVSASATRAGILTEPLSSCASASLTTSCPNYCSGHGSCSSATRECTCFAGYAGDDCRYEIIEIPVHETQNTAALPEFTLGPLETMYFSFVIPPNPGSRSLIVEVNRAEPDSVVPGYGYDDTLVDPDVWLRRSALPTEARYDDSDDSEYQYQTVRESSSVLTSGMTVFAMVKNYNLAVGNFTVEAAMAGNFCCEIPSTNACPTYTDCYTCENIASCHWCPNEGTCVDPQLSASTCTGTFNESTHDNCPFTTPCDLPCVCRAEEVNPFYTSPQYIGDCAPNDIEKSYECECTRFNDADSLGRYREMWGMLIIAISVVLLPILCI